MEKYKTVKKNNIFEAEYEVQKSKFITYVQNVDSEEAAKNFLQQIRKKHFNATHNCSAWVLGVKGDKQKSNDDGEPGGTAGNPILETIKKNALTNIIIVVTRYFGGIKLGAGGLIRAYSHAAALGISASKILIMTPVQKVNVKINYNLLASVENWIRQKKIIVNNIDYADNVTLNLMIIPEQLNEELKDLEEITAGKLEYQIEEQVLVEKEEV